MPADRSRLGPDRRAADLARLASEPFDVVVVGGGITGTGAALDAASRGLSVALIEARDWAAGTSSRSSKLVHGGLRYLEQLALPLVREALVERGRQLRIIAPHLVRPQPFLLPLTAPVWPRAYYGAGLALYDGLAASFGGSGVSRHRHLSRRATLRVFPALAPAGLHGAFRYFDAQVDDARHTLAVARTAAAYGAAAVSSLRVVGLLWSGGAVAGVRARCLETGQTVQVRGRAVIAATGVWSDDIGRMLGGSAHMSLRVRASKGVHLVVPRDRIDGSAGLILRTPSSVLFVIPWEEHWIVGTTDTDWNLDRAHPAASSADIDYLLGQLNRVLARPLERADIQGVYAGLRPLLAGESDATSRLSREHAVVSPAPGLVLVAGGKYTTYRVMAADAVAAATAAWSGVPASRTACLPLVGARTAVDADRLARRYAAAPVSVRRLVGRYGDRTADVLTLAAQRPELAAPLPGAPEHLAAEVHYAALAEGALHLDDVLTRRTRISVQTEHRGLASAERVAALMADVLGWTATDEQREIEHYRARVAAERESQQMPDDQTADAARKGVPDVRGRVLTYSSQMPHQRGDVMTLLAPSAPVDRLRTTERERERPRFHRLTNVVQTYSWGSRTALAEFRAAPSPAVEPEAELWLGAHPSAPSRVQTPSGERSLLEMVAGDPQATLGPALVRRPGACLPFLLKVLAVGSPLSLQVHPDRTGARKGYAAEEQAGIAPNSPERVFRDENHKPELICALTPFEALCGLRPAGQIVALLSDLDVPQLRPAVQALTRRPGAPALRGLLETILEAADPDGLVGSVLAAAGRRAPHGGPFRAAYDGAAALAERFPGDAGVVVSMLLNRLRLEPGEATYLPAGRLHAYLSGLGIEVMACSDNVVRGGLSAKHVDVAQLLAAADFGPEQLTPVRPEPGRDGWLRYGVPVEDFAFARATLTDGRIDSLDPGPQVLLCVDGELQLADGAQTLTLVRGQSVFAPADTPIAISGTGALVRATAG